MPPLVVLNLGKGTCQTGFSNVIAQVWLADELAPVQFMAALPPALELESLHRRWQRLYEALYASLNWRQISADLPKSSLSKSSMDALADEVEEFEIDEEDATLISRAEFDRLCQALQQAFNQWLNAESFRKIDQKLRTLLNPIDEIRVIVTAESHDVLRLPWQFWHLLEDYPRSELALGPAEYARSIKAVTPKGQRAVKLLAILGDRQGIDIEQDARLLKQLPEADVTFLVEPSRADLSQHLWQAGWDILFFAGHSSSQGEGQIQVNPGEALTIEQLKYGLRTAIAHGLKLAIFNSCDGLGLAQDLADLHLPQVIVMREPVPDRVAQVFLKQFLAAFAAGRSLYGAVREAREKLQDLETEFPCATWLPVICQNPAEAPPYWHDWCGKRPAPMREPLRKALKPLLLSSIAVTGLTLAVRWFGLLQPIELWAFDRLLQARPPELPDERLLIVSITEQDIQDQGQEPRFGTLSESTLNRLLQTLERYQPRAIGLDLYRDYPSNLPELATRMRDNANLIAICKRPDSEADPTGIVPPPELSDDRIGFSDFVQDEDGAVRRHLLLMSPDVTSLCTTAYAFSTQLAFRYFDAQGIAPQFTADGDLQFKDVVFHRLHNRSGGYQPTDARGRQILLNYRTAPTPQDIAQRVTVGQLLKHQIQPEAIKDRIVLIGLTAPSSGDSWVTPYGRSFSQKLPGVVIHAQMVSQLLSAVLDRRPLLWVWPIWIEALWVGGWALIGGWLSWRIRHRLALGGAIGLSSLALLGLCWGLLIQGGWVPLIPALMALGIAPVAIVYLQHRLKKL